MTSLPVIPFVLATVLAGHGWRKKSLSPGGSIAAFIVGFLMLSVPVQSFGYSLIIFYLTGSRATKCERVRNFGDEPERLLLTERSLASQSERNSKRHSKMDTTKQATVLRGRCSATPSALSLQQSHGASCLRPTLSLRWCLQN